MSSIIATALAHGLLSEEDVVWRAVEVVPIGSSHPVHRVSVDGVPRAVVKTFGPRAGDTDGDPAREHAVRALGARVPEVGALLAPAVPWDDDPSAVAAAFVDAPTMWQLASGDTSGGDRAAVARAGLRRLSACLVPALAGMHRATRHLVAVDLLADGAGSTAPTPWVLRLLDGDAPADVWRTPPLARLVSRWATGDLEPEGGGAADRSGPDASTGGRDQALRAVRALREARERWRPMCLVHGDLKHDNVLVSPEDRVTLLDWEMSRLGDPAWDLAALITPLPLSSERGHEWSEDNLAAVAGVVGAYADESRLPVPALARRTVLYVGAWLLMTAVQFRSTQPAEPEATDADVVAARARHTLADVDALTARLLRTIGAVP